MHRKRLAKDIIKLKILEFMKKNIFKLLDGYNISSESMRNSNLVKFQKQPTFSFWQNKGIMKQTV